MLEHHEEKLEAVAKTIISFETDSRHVKSKKNYHLKGNRELYLNAKGI